eukprot:TRINITY_DN55366_c0_g1_i1.p1 TRINITY_DN55366_c0_g1~~TRINITY_DN55366_c0_g1_i1.p1  ORF type:complete len:362 (-),score=47.57 TRINITY_DN55366_c0_g1_i1:336-1421(-)
MPAMRAQDPVWSRVMGGTTLLPEWAWVKLPECLGGKGLVVPIRVHYLLVVIPVLMGISTLIWSASAGKSGAFAFLIVLIVLLTLGPMLYLTVLLHELGHTIAAVRKGAKPIEILLWPLGGLASTETTHTGTSYCDRIYIAVMGPAVHVPLSLIWFVMGSVAAEEWTLSTQGRNVEKAGDWFEVFFILECQLNLIMLGFNLLIPSFPLDCSAILVNLLAWCGMHPHTIAIVLVGSSVVVILLLCTYAIWAMSRQYWGAVIWLAVAAFLAYNTWLIHNARVQGKLQETSVFNDRSERTDPEEHTLFEKMFEEHKTKQDHQPEQNQSDKSQGASSMDLSIVLVSAIVLYQLVGLIQSCEGPTYN